MKAYRVWSTFDDETAIDGMCSAAFEIKSRADTIAETTNREHQERVPGGRCRYEVREEEIPRDFDFNGTPSRVVMVFLGDDDHPTDVSHRP